MTRARDPDRFYDTACRWQDELGVLRKLLLETGLTETVKWGSPCYTHEGANIVSVVSFKSYFGLWFFQGALLDDAEGVLINAQAGNTRAQRQWRMRDVSDIRPAIIRRYLDEAVKLADTGATIAQARNRALVIPDELQQALDENASSKKQFDALRPGQKREYANHVADAKRAETRRRRVEKILPMIARGIGLNDRYR